MIKMTVMTLAATLALAPGAFGQTGTPTTTIKKAPVTDAPAAKKLSVDSTVKELLDDTRTRQILTTHVPLIVENAPNYPDILPMTFRALAAMTEAQTMAGLTPEVFKKIETEIAAL